MERRKEPEGAGSDLVGSSQEWDGRQGGPLESRAWSRQGSDSENEGFRSGEARVPYSVAVDEQGYSSSGAMSDERNLAYRPMRLSSTRSVGSVGSQGSGERFVSYSAASLRSYSGPPTAAHLMNGEAQFPSAGLSYAASEAAKSDIATVCSGSVADDIEVSSVLSAELNGPQASSGGVGTSRRQASGGRVEFASLAQYATILQNPGLPLTFQPDRISPFHHAETEPSSMVALNDMGPPVSRGLLLQPAGSGSRPGSVKSFGSRGSDVIAHVDTDDCGGSIIESVTDGHSVHSQEDTAVVSTDVGAVHALEQETNSGKAPPLVHPLLQNSNGRVSPGGTVYKGKGVRRYQGRYMHLPLKRFTQNGVNMESVFRDSLVAGPLPTPRQGHTDDYDCRRFGRDHDWREQERERYPGRGDSPPKERASPLERTSERRRQDQRRDSHYFETRKRSQSRTRSRSRSPPPRTQSPKRKGSSRHSFRRREGSSRSPVRKKNERQRSRGGRSSRSNRNGKPGHRNESPVAGNRSPSTYRRTRWS